MLADIDTVLRSLEAEADEVTVIVDPGIEAFCVMGARRARGTIPPRSSSSGRVPLVSILAYLRANAADDEDEDDAEESA